MHSADDRSLSNSAEAGEARSGRAQPQPALVLAVGLDDLTLGLLTAALRGTELSLVSASVDAALARVQRERRPVLALVEWAPEQEARNARLSLALRRAAPHGQCGVIALGSGGDVRLSRAMEAVDDVLCRPFGEPAIALLRLRQSLRLFLGQRADLTPRKALEEAVNGEQSGEVVVRSGDVVGHIHMQGGQLVWANVSSHPASIDEIVGYTGVTLAREVVREVRDEAYDTRAHFMDILVARGLLTFEDARRALRGFIGERVERVMALPDARAMFLPRSTPETDHVRLRVDEIPSLAPRSTPPEGVPVRLSLPPTTLPPDAAVASADIEALVERAMAIDGARSAAVLDRRTGASLMVVGADIDTAVASSQLAALSALGPDAEDVLASVGAYCFVTRALHEAPGLALFVVLRRADITIGLARVLIGQLAMADAAILRAASELAAS